MPTQREKIKLSFNQILGLIVPYVKKRVVEQIKSIALIIIYLMLFQTLILNIAVADATIIALGIVVVVLGLTFFMEGLFLGLMPLGEVIGVKLPQKTKLPIILIFAFVLGVGVTLAEPAIGVLKIAGSSVKAWQAPLLFLLLNKLSNFLVYAVGIGVGLAVLFGVLRFLYNWSLKPFLYILVSILTGITIWASLDPNLIYLVGLAWDCGGVTTGPVTVPLVLALGIGICRIVASESNENAGFGVVTLASLFPIITVLLLGIFFVTQVPKPMDEQKFFSVENREKALKLFNHQEEMIGYAFMNSSINSQISLFNGKENMLQYLKNIRNDTILKTKVFGTADNALAKWAIYSGNEEQKLAVFDTYENIEEMSRKYFSTAEMSVNVPSLVIRNCQAATQAIIPLTLFLVLVLLLVLREKIPRVDEIVLGIFFALIGMGLFNIGIEIGLSKLGNQVGAKLPSAFKQIFLADEKKTIPSFDKSVVQESISPKGEKQKFFYFKLKNEYKPVPFTESMYDNVTKQYIYTPSKGPLFGTEGSFTGILVVLIFAFIMGYGATLAEPALNALGVKVEEITVGTFKKSMLMQAVAVGVGLGMTVGLVKIIWNLPLYWLLIPPYLVLLYISKISSEEYVNIGWDSAGVTTGPITVPLVLAMGLGIGGQVGVVEGFGILATASVFPILTVLSVGLYVNRKRSAVLKESPKK